MMVNLHATEMNCQIDGATLRIMEEEQKLEALRQIAATRRQRLQKAKDLIKQFVKPNGPVVDEFIIERHEEAAQHE